VRCWPSRRIFTIEQLHQIIIIQHLYSAIKSEDTEALEINTCYNIIVIIIITITIIIIIILKRRRKFITRT